MRPQSRRRLGLLRLSQLAGWVAIGLLPVAVQAQQGPNTSPGAEAEVPSPSAVVKAIEEVFVDVAERVMPSVVTVHVRGSVTSVDRELHELFPDLPPMLEPPEGTGSGFVVDTAGTIFTNHHVVKDAEQIQVILRDGSRFKADLVGADVESDVAVIRMLEPPAGLAIAELGDSDAVRVGQFAIAIGSPMGFQNSLTVGHVSAKERSNIGRRSPGLATPGFENLSYQDFLQVDTPINPGNSGGPLVDIQGRVIGINTAIIAAGGGGIGFSIPINMARNIAEQLVAKGKVSRGWLGVTPVDPSPEQLTVHGLKRPTGASIQAVLPDTPAYRAGLQVDDVIISFNQHTINSANELMNAVATAPIDEKLPCELLRLETGGKVRSHTLQVLLTERPGLDERRALVLKLQNGEAQGNDIDSEAWIHRELGLQVQKLTGQLNSKLKRKRSATGLHVVRVQPGSAGAEAGLRTDDVVLEANHHELKSPKDLRTAVQGTQRAFIPLAIERAGAKKYLSLERP